MRRTLVGGRTLSGVVRRLAQPDLGAGKALGQLRQLAGQLEDDAVLLLDMPLQEGKTLLEVAKAGIHAPRMRGGGDRASRCLAYD